MIFDIFYETAIKYFFLYLPAQYKTEILYAPIPVWGKLFLLIWQQFHCTIADID